MNLFFMPIAQSKIYWAFLLIFHFQKKFLVLNKFLFCELFLIWSKKRKFFIYGNYYCVLEANILFLGAFAGSYLVWHQLNNDQVSFSLFLMGLISYPQCTAWHVRFTKLKILSRNVGVFPVVFSIWKLIIFNHGFSTKNTFGNMQQRDKKGNCQNLTHVSDDQVSDHLSSLFMVSIKLYVCDSGHFE